MPSQLETAYANFAKMKPEQIKPYDDSLVFLRTAQLPTQQGAFHRAMMQTTPLDPESLKALAAYASYKAKLEYKPMDEKHKTALRLGKVPDAEIERLGSREKWEQDQLSTFDSFLEPQKSNVKTMEPEVITAAAPKPARSGPRPEPMERMSVAASMPAQEAAPMPPIEPAPPMQPQMAMMNQGAPLPPPPESKLGPFASAAANQGMQ